MELHDRAEPKHLSAADSLAIERLLDQQELAGNSAALAQRSARRLCGRWLLLRRVGRGLTLEQMAERVGAEVEALRLLEQGLLSNPLLADTVWERLGLVLEGNANDFQHVIMVARVACNLSAAPSAAWLHTLREELQSPPELPTVAAGEVPANPDLLRSADELVQQESKWKLPRHNMLVLQALRRVHRRTLSIADLKDAVLELDPNVDLNLATIRELLRQLQQAAFVERVSDAPSGYRITPQGTRTCVAALRQSAARSELQTELRPLLQAGKH